MKQMNRTGHSGGRRRGIGGNPRPRGRRLPRGGSSSPRPRVRRSGGDAQLDLGEFDSDGDREEEGEKTPSGEATGGVPSSPPAGRAARRAPLPSGPGASPGRGRGRYRSTEPPVQRGAGRGGSRDGKVRSGRPSEEHEEYFFSARSRRCRCSPTPPARLHGRSTPLPGRGGGAGLCWESPQGKARIWESNARLNPGRREPGQGSRLGKGQHCSGTMAGRVQPPPLPAFAAFALLPLEREGEKEGRERKKGKKKKRV